MGPVRLAIRTRPLGRALRQPPAERRRRGGGGCGDDPEGGWLIRGAGLPRGGSVSRLVGRCAAPASVPRLPVTRFLSRCFMARVLIVDDYSDTARTFALMLR